MMTGEKLQDNNTPQSSGNIADKAELSKKKPVCGIIRPISAMPPEYSEQHWKDVAFVLDEAIKEAGFQPKLVSNAAEISVIQKTIIQNLYDCPIVVCDISGKNANVMFELGLRLAFDKPTIIIKDDNTGDSFDTAPIERLEYKNSLHYLSILDFKKNLKAKLLATIAKADKDENYSPFLRNFGELVPAKINKQEVPQQKFWQKKLDNMEEMLSSIVSGLARREEERSKHWIKALYDDNRKERRRNYDLPQRELFQRLEQAQEELRHVSSAAAAAEKRKEIEKLEKLIFDSDDYSLTI